MKNKTIAIVASALLSAAALAAGEGPKNPKTVGTADPPVSRAVKYGDRDVVPIRAQLRHATLIVLPEGERILDFVCGDAEYWIIDGAENFAHVKPAKEGSRTNLNLIAASGRVYSFSLREISGEKGAAPDLKVFVEPKEGSRIARAGGAERFVTAEELKACRASIDQVETQARKRAEAAEADARKRIESFRSSYPLSLRFVYDYPHGKKPFNVRAIYHDGRFTYIRARPSEAPALYELQDGKASLVGFDYRDGVYVASKVIERGYLSVGRQRLRFRIRGR